MVCISYFHVIFPRLFWWFFGPLAAAWGPTAEGGTLSQHCQLRIILQDWITRIISNLPGRSLQQKMEDIYDITHVIYIYKCHSPLMSMRYPLVFVCPTLFVQIIWSVKKHNWIMMSTCTIPWASTEAYPGRAFSSTSYTYTRMESFMLMPGSTWSLDRWLWGEKTIIIITEWKMDTGYGKKTQIHINKQYWCNPTTKTKIRSGVTHR